MIGYYAVSNNLSLTLSHAVIDAAYKKNFFFIGQTRTRRGFKESTANLMINFLQTNDASPSDEDQYYCTAFSQAGTTENCVSVTVLGNKIEHE